MGHSLSANKRERQNETRRLRNKGNKITVKKELKKFDAVLLEKSVNSQDALKAVYSALDTAVHKKVMPKGRADRKKARLALQLNRKLAATQ